MANCTASITLYGNSVDPGVTVSCSLVVHPGEHRAIGGSSMYRRRDEPDSRRFRGVMAGYEIRWSDPDGEAEYGDL